MNLNCTQPSLAEGSPPVFVVGRQHCGNTMLVTALAQIPGVLGMAGESDFFERIGEITATPLSERARRVAGAISRGFDPPLASATVDELAAALVETGDDDATRLFRSGITWVTSRIGATRWVQKATSYVFYIDALLDRFPDARLVFLLRNPLDLAASIKRRDGSAAMLRLLVGWNRGVRAATGAMAAHPDRLLVVRYEDLVTRPDEELARICHFARLDAPRDLADVPHVNRAETRYNRTSGVHGITSSRCFRFRGELSPAEERMVRGCVDPTLLRRFYPMLADVADVPRWTLRRRFVAAGLCLRGAARIATAVGRQGVGSPRLMIDRVARRVRFD